MFNANTSIKISSTGIVNFLYNIACIVMNYPETSLRGIEVKYSIDSHQGAENLTAVRQVIPCKPLDSLSAEQLQHSRKLGIPASPAGK